VLDVRELIRCVFLCMLEVVNGGLCSLEVPEVMRRVLALYARGRGGCALFAGDVGRIDAPDAPEVMRCVLLCMLEAVDGRLCSLEVMRCMLLRMLDAGGCGW